tara:strand:- start:3197 stop:4369 length:1173 start_codon:yes stop_codon:yes gene_type:complete
MKGGHNGPCGISKATNKCKKSSVGHSQCEVSSKGACRKKTLPVRSTQGLISKFEIIIKYYQINPEELSNTSFKIRQYNRAIAILKQYPHVNLESVEDLKAHFIKNGIKNPKTSVEKATEYHLNGTVSLAEKALALPQIQSVINLTKIYAVGPKKALQLYNSHDIITIDDLKNILLTNPTIINTKQKIGLRYFDDLQTRIPRKEIEGYKKKFSKIATLIPGIIVSINGSYRRGLKSSGDLDILITTADPQKNQTLLRKKFIAFLVEKSIIVEVLASGRAKFMGISKLTTRSKARHIDIIDTSPDKYPFAQLYFTGSGGFNIHMRGVAIAHGYSLNEYSLTHRKTKKPLEPDEIFAKINKHSFENERDIFAFLGMKYLKPEKRNMTTSGKIM